MYIKDNKREDIMKTFNKFMESASDVNEFDKRINIIKEIYKEYNFRDYISALMVISEYYDLLSKDKNYEEVVYNYMVKIKKGLENNLNNIEIGLFSGLSDFGYCINGLIKHLPYYEKFLNTLNEILIDKVETLIKNPNEYVDYDAISGLAGCGAYLLMFKENDKVLNTIKTILNYLVEMCEDIKVKNHLVPGWYRKKEDLYGKKVQERFQDGNFDISLAHGISGVLVFLSLALKENIEVKNQREAIKKILRDLKRFYKKDENNSHCWAGLIDFNDYIKENTEFRGTGRQSWCYGAIGISRSLYIAGQALNDKELIDFSTNVVEDIAQSDLSTWNLESSILCHGYGSVLAIMEAMYKDTKNPKFKECSDKIVEVILNSFDEKSLFGFYNYGEEYKKRFSIDEELELKYVDDYSFLEGSSGIVLCLMNYLYPERNSWMRHLLID